MDEGIVRSLAAPAYATNPAGYLVSYNDAAATLWGYRPELGKLRWCGSWKLFWSDSRPMDRDDCALALAFKAGPPTQPQTGIFERPDGFRLLYRAFPSVLRDAAGAIAGGLNILIETTERQASAIEMAKLASIIDGSNDAIISKSLDGIVLSWNQGAARIFGYSSEQMKGQSISRIIPQEFRAEEEMILATLRQGGIVEPFDTVRVAKDGHLVDVSLTVSPVYDGAGNVVGASKVAREISDKKRAEADAKTNEERFRLISLATNDAIWDLDLETGKLWWNEGLRDFFGYKDSDLESDANIWMARIHPDDRVRILRRRREMLRSGITNWSDEVRFNRVDGTVAIAVVRCFVIRGETGGATCLLGSISDVTERRAIDEQLRQSQKLEAVGQLTGGVAHDFNNLLTVILGNSEELAASLSGDLRLRSLAEMTATAAERGAELTRRLLAFARKQPLAPKAMDVNALLAGMDQLLRRTLSEAIEIDVIGHAGPWKAIIDPGQLESALLNLTLNARDAMPNGGRLIIATSNVSLDEQYARQTAEVIPGEYVLISISDTGSGMNEATIRRAFEPFFTTKDTGKGSGLGLSMVYGFIKQSMGHIKIYSETGFGTTVKLYLPRAASDDDVTVATSGDEAPMTGNESILVVEDDDLVRTYVSGLLDALGYKVTSAKNGPDALKTLRYDPKIQLLFTDIVMPGGFNGRQLADRAREIRPDMPVLFTSGYSEDAILHHGRLDRGVQLLSKPYRKQELAAKIRQALDGKTKRRMETLHKPKICIVEDDGSVRAVLKMMLEGGGYDVEADSDGKNLLKREAFDDLACIIMDINLPGESGIQILKHLRDRGVQTPVLIATARLEDNVRLEATKLNAAGLLEKPFRPGALLDAIAAVLGGATQI